MSQQPIRHNEAAIYLSIYIYIYLVLELLVLLLLLSLLFIFGRGTPDASSRLCDVARTGCAAWHSLPPTCSFGFRGSGFRVEGLGVWGLRFRV